MSFYNKYRPITLDELDNKGVQKTLASLLSKKKEDLPHAFLFSGPKGTGKTTAARIIAKLFNCEHPLTSGEPCGECSLCLSIAKGSALDVIEIDAASNTGVDNIRDIKDKILLAPVQAKWKIYIIDEVHMLSTGAFNALLKTLEEPPSHTVFILATTDPHKIPETITSRCVHIPFNKPHIQEITKALERIIQAEKITVDPEALTIISEMADGSFRDATKLLEQASLRSNHITKIIVQETLSSTDAHQIQEFIRLMLDNKPIAGIQLLETIQKEGIDVRRFFAAVIKEFQKILIDAVINKKTEAIQYKNILDILHSYYADTRGSNLPDVTLQLALLTICTAHTEQNSLPQPSQKQEPQPKPLHQTPPQQPVQTIKQEVKPALELTNNEYSLASLQTNWPHIIDEVKKYHHATAGVLRSAKPKDVHNDVLVLETAYSFHKDKLSESQAKNAIIQAIKSLFGKTITVTIELMKK